jgi:quercetin dioxygenase-like cupin family protein
MAGKTVVRQPGEGEAFWMLGGLYEIKASSDETDDQATIVEMRVPAGSGPPPHTHPGGEAVYVLEGTVRYHIEDEVFEGGPGSFFYMPEGTWENFEPTSEIHLLVIYTPGGVEKFFAEAGEPAQRREIPPPMSEPPDVERIIAIGEKHGMKLKAPQQA